MKYILLILTIMFCAYSCTRNHENEQLLQAKSIVETNPDSALALLKSIKHPENLDKTDFYLYHLLMTQAKYNSGVDISSDTIMKEVQSYFIEKKDIKYSALSGYYYAQVLKKRNALEEAIAACMDVEKYAEQTNDNYLKGSVQFLIGDLHIINFMDKEAIPYMKKAAQYFHEDKNTQKEMQALKDISVCYIVIKASEIEKGNKEDKTHESDSALVYSDRAFNIASILNDSIQIADILLNKGTVYSMQGNNERAKEMFYQSQPFFEACEEMDLIKNYNLVALFYNEAEADSAIYYLNKSKEIADKIQLQDPYFYASQYSQLADFYKAKEDYKDELKYRKLSISTRDSIFETMHSEALLDIQEKYHYEVEKNANTRLRIQTQYLSIVLLISGLVIIIIFSLVYYRRLKYKKDSLEIRQKIYDLRQMADNYNEKIESTRNILLKRFETLKKSALLESYLHEDEKLQGQKLLQKFNEIVYQDSSFNWDILYSTINELNDGFFDNVKEKYPDLDDIEFKICCLIYIGFSNAEISIVLEKSVNTIVSKRTSIRKKLGMKEHANIIDFLGNQIK